MRKDGRTEGRKVDGPPSPTGDLPSFRPSVLARLGSSLRPSFRPGRAWAPPSGEWRACPTTPDTWLTWPSGTPIAGRCPSANSSRSTSTPATATAPRGAARAGRRTGTMTSQLPSRISQRRVLRLILLTFLLAFVGARALAVLMMARILPDIYLHVRGTHVHHLNYGIFLLATVGAYLLLVHPSDRGRRHAAVVYGVGLALTFDEFGMW